MAYEWQNTIAQNTEVVVNGNKYVGPHKYVVCLLGDDTYAVNQFMIKEKESLNNKQ